MTLEQAKDLYHTYNNANSCLSALIKMKQLNNDYGTNYSKQEIDQQLIRNAKEVETKLTNEYNLYESEYNLLEQHVGVKDLLKSYNDNHNTSTQTLKEFFKNNGKN